MEILIEDSKVTLTGLADSVIHPVINKDSELVKMLILDSDITLVRTIDSTIEGNANG